MKVWWVLGWESYYPESELGNVRSTFATQEEAEDEAQQLKDNQVFAHVRVRNVSSLLGL